MTTIPQSQGRAARNADGSLATAPQAVKFSASNGDSRATSDEQMRGAVGEQSALFDHLEQNSDAEFILESTYRWRLVSIIVTGALPPDFIRRQEADIRDYDPVERYFTKSQASPLMDDSTLQLFAHFISNTGPAIDIFDPCVSRTSEGLRPLWTHTLPFMALDNLGLLHAMLALSSLQIAKLQGASTSLSLLHLFLALMRFNKDIRDNNMRHNVVTLAMQLLFSSYELMAEDYLNQHSRLQGARRLLSEIGFPITTRKPTSQEGTEMDTNRTDELSPPTSEQGSEGSPDEKPVSGVINNAETLRSGSDQGKAPHHFDLQEGTLYEDLWWYFLRQDAYQSVFRNSDPIMDYSNWSHFSPRGRVGRSDAVYGTHDHIVLLLGRIANFSVEDRKRKLVAIGRMNTAWRPPVGGEFKGLGTGWDGSSPGLPRWEYTTVSAYTDQKCEVELEIAVQEWCALLSALEILISQLGPQYGPIKADDVELNTEPNHHTFGPGIFFRQPDVAVINALCHMCRILLYRAHPQMPADSVFAVGVAMPFTADAANKIGQIAAGIFTLIDEPISSADPLHAQKPREQQRRLETLKDGILYEIMRPLLVAGIEFQSEQQRIWLVDHLHEIEILTGWASGGSDCEMAWQSAHDAGRGPPWEGSGYWPQRSSHIELDADIILPSPLDSGKIERGDVLPYRARPKAPDDNGQQMPVTNPNDALNSEERGERKDTPRSLHEQQPEKLSARAASEDPLSSNALQDSAHHPEEHRDLRSPSVSSMLLDPGSTASSSSDCPSTDVEGPSVLSRESQAEILVERLMRHFFLRLNAWTAVPTDDGSGNMDSTENQNNAPQLGCNHSEAAKSNTNSDKRSKRTRDNRGRDRDEEDCESGDDNRRGKRPKDGQSSKDDRVEQRKLACPYYKRDPRKYQDWRSCCGPGWGSVHRLKEHLYRRHALPINCNRCGYIAETDSLLREHQRADTPCEKSETPSLNGFDKDQEKLLKCRKRNQSTENEKWVEVYSILFPEDDQEFIPCPYYESSDLYYEFEPSSSSAALGRYEEFLRSELPARVKRELCKEIEQELETSEARIKKKLPNIVRIVQKTLSDVFQSCAAAPGDVNPQEIRSPPYQDPFDLPIAQDFQQPSWDQFATDEQLMALLGDDLKDFCQEMPNFPRWTPDSSKDSLDG